MPRAAPRPCTYPGCSTLCSAGRCDKHRAQIQREADQRRGGSTERGYDSAWQRAREAYLGAHPLCAECMRAGQVTAAVVVDHIIPHKGDRKLFWDSANWQPLCKRCHDRKTAREDGGFGARVGGPRKSGASAA